MPSVFILSLFIAISWLSAPVKGECCATVQDLTFSIEDAHCGAVGGYGSSDRCHITICNDGYVLTGSFCGKGPCNPIGCSCTDGCVRGDWSRSFLENYKEYSIDILEENWASGPSLLARRLSDLFYLG